MPKKNYSGTQYPELSSKPPNPESGHQKLYPKSDGEWYALDDAGNERAVVDHQRATFAVHHTASDTDIAQGNGIDPASIPASMNGWEVIAVLSVITGTENGVQSASETMDTQLRRRRAGSDVDVLSAKNTFTGAEWSSANGTINASNKTLVTGDCFFADVDTILGNTTAKGLIILVTAEKP